MKLGIICCYGIYSKEIRSIVEMEGLTTYYQSIDEYFIENHQQYSKIVYSGGYTNKEFGIISECESRPVGKFMSGKEMNETASLDTLENITYAIQTARLFLDEVTEITIFCDTARKNKVIILANELLPTKWNISVQSFERQDIHPHSTEKYQNSTIPDILTSPKFRIFKELLEVTINP
jgi:hypothetical protein